MYVCLSYSNFLLDLQFWNLNLNVHILRFKLMRLLIINSLHLSGLILLGLLFALPDWYIFP